jgi:peptidoglycan/LPS O-acetylase OafA/YrhL
MTIEEQTDRQRAPYLDGLRGVAALMVMVGHLVMMVWPSLLVTEVFPVSTPAWQLGLAASPLSALWDGRLAVSVFFILSGYVLTSAATARRAGFPALAGKRYLRLALPVLAATLPTLLLKPLGWYFNHELAFVTGSAWMDSVTSSGFQPSLLSWLRNAFWVVFFVDGHTSYNALLWTMKFEWYGSLLVFLLTSLLPHRGWRLAVACLLLAWLGLLPTYVYLHLFMVGLIFHDTRAVWRDRMAGTIVIPPVLADIGGILLLAFGVYLPRLVMVMVTAGGNSLAALLWLRAALPSWQADRWMIGAVPVVLGVLLAPRLQHWLGLPLCRFLGRISFPLYLFHLPIILSLGSWLMLSLLPRMSLVAAAVITFAVTAGLALMVASIMEFLVERPTLRLSSWAGRRIDRGWARIRPWRPAAMVKDYV